MVFVPFRFYGPDLEPSQKGVIRDGENLIPTINGFAAAPGAVGTSVDALTASALMAISIEQTDGSVRTFAATSTEIFERNANVWVDRSQGANDYTAATSWVFTQLGNQTLATNNTSAIQQSTSGAFADLSGAPRAAAIEAVNNQLFAFNTTDATFGAQGDRWRVSALGDTADWTPSITTQAASARLLTTPGAIVGGRRLGDDIAVYKQESLYLGRFFGPPTIWEFDVISNEIGAVSHNGIIVLDTAHAFMGRHDFYIFNGASVSSIGAGMREEFFQNELNRDFQEKTQGIWDKRNNRLLWFYPSNSGSGQLDRYIVYDLQRGVWGPPNDLSVETAFIYLNPTSPTYDTLGNSFATYNDLPLIAYDAGFWQTEQLRPAIFDTSHNVQTLDGSAGASSVRIFDFGAELVRGDPTRFSFLSRVRPRFASTPNSATMVNSYREDLGGDFTSDAPTATLINGKFDVERESRWHSLRMDFDGDMEILGVDIDIQAESEE